jgi:hypothetical protein
MIELSSKYTALLNPTLSWLSPLKRKQVTQLLNLYLPTPLVKMIEDYTKTQQRGSLVTNNERGIWKSLHCELDSHHLKVSSNMPYPLNEIMVIKYQTLFEGETTIRFGTFQDYTYCKKHKQCYICREYNQKVLQLEEMPHSYDISYDEQVCLMKGYKNLAPFCIPLLLTYQQLDNIESIEVYCSNTVYVNTTVIC